MPRINIAAVQYKWKIEDYKDRQALEDRICSIMEYTRSKTDSSLPLLVAFPEDIGTPMLLFGSYCRLKDKKDFAGAVKCLIMENFFSVMKYKLRYGVSFIRSLMLAKSVSMEEDYIRIFSSIANKYNAYIAAGSITLPDIMRDGKRAYPAGKNVYNVSYFFSPDKIIGKQKKVHLVGFEGESGFDLSPGNIDDITVFDTPFGKAGIAICLDAFKEDVCERLQSSGADILIQPSANNGEWSAWQQQDWLNGSYLAAHERKRFKYAVNPMMNGSILDLAFEGQSSIIYSGDTDMKSNYTLLEPADGFIRIAKHHDTEEVLISTVEI